MKKAIGLTIAGMFLIAGTVSGDILIDQIGDGSEVSGARASQDFEATWDAYDCIIIDNFSIDDNYTLDTFSAVFGGWGAWAGQYDAVTQWNINIYSSPQAAGGNLTGDIASLAIGQSGWSAIDIGFLGGDPLTAKISFDVSSLQLGPGTYWIGVNGSLVFGDNGQIGVSDSTYGSPLGDDEWQANPGGGFGQGTEWQTGTNAAYELSGVVPAPGALALLGLAGFVARRRRR